MKRATISLPDELARALDREARRSHTSVSEVARIALTKYLDLVPGEAHELAFAELGRSGHRTTARNMEQFLKQEWGSSWRV